MHKIISIVGKSGSGKTTLLERLIGELKQRGYKVGIVKHSHHDNDLDMAQKDTWRYTKAGSSFSAINSLDHLAIYRRIDSFFDPREISDSIMWDYDIILTEGFKGSPYPKIEVHNPRHGADLLTDPDQLLAVVSDEPLDNEIPRFTRNDITAIADLIEQTIKESSATDDLNMVVNGIPVSLSETDRTRLKEMLLTMLPSGHNPADIRTMHVSLRRKS